MADSKLIKSLRLPLRFIIALWAIHIFQFVAGWSFAYLGIFPRSVEGLKGILFAPLIHGDFMHLLNNSIPLFATSALILFFYPRVAIRSFVMIYLLTGLAVWLFGNLVFAERVAYHIGASGVVYGLVSFIFWTGVFRRNLKSIVLGLLVAFYYSGMFLGILPNQEGISWESHLLGGLVGIFVAFWYKDELEADEAPVKYSWEEEDANENQSYFLDRDVFEKTRDQRLREQRDRENNGGGWFSSGTW